MYEGQVGVSCMRGDVARRAPNRSDMCFYSISGTTLGSQESFNISTSKVINVTVISQRYAESCTSLFSVATLLPLIESLIQRFSSVANSFWFPLSNPSFSLSLSSTVGLHGVRSFNLPPSSQTEVS